MTMSRGSGKLKALIDPSWTMHLIGDEIERITGYPAEDFIDNRRRTYGSVIHPDDRAHVERSVWEAVESESAELAGEGRVLVRPSGTEQVVRVMVEAPTQERC